MEAGVFIGGIYALACGLLLSAALFAPRTGPAAWWARTVSGLSLGWAAWTLATLPRAFFDSRERLLQRQWFYEHLAFVPILAVIGAVALLVIHMTATRGATPGSLRALIADRGQILVMTSVVTLQVFVINRAWCGACEVFAPWKPVATVTALVATTIFAARKIRA